MSRENRRRPYHSEKEINVMYDAVRRNLAKRCLLVENASAADTPYLLCSNCKTTAKSYRGRLISVPKGTVHQFLENRDIKSKTGDTIMTRQIWTCIDCKSERAWGCSTLGIV